MTNPSPLERSFDLYRRTAASRSALLLLAANAVPLVGVVLLGWSLWTILALYWLENGIVGFWNVPRILLAGGPATGRVGLAVFFCVHYGLFWLVHGVFVFVLPSFMGAFVGATVDRSPFVEPASTMAFGTLDPASVAVAGVGLLLSHGASFVWNFLRGGESQRTSPAAQMARPYGRVVVLHVTILLGAFAIAFLGAPILLLVVMVVAKTLFDLGLHLREHAG